MQATRPPQLRLLSRLLDLQAPTHPVQQPLPFRRFHTPRSHLTPSRRPPSLQTPHPRPRLPSSRTLRAFRSRFNSTQPSPETTSSPSLSARLKKLSREYGWSALGIYLLLSALDFPFCFLAVRLLGTERIGRWEHAVVEGVKSLVLQIPGAEALWRERFGVGHAQGADGGVVEEEPRRLLEQEVEAVEERWDHGVEEAEKANQGETASIWTQLALAYAIHKSFIFLRVPLTAAVTPKVVKTLRGWGWDIGKRRLKQPNQIVAGTGTNAEKGTGVNITGKK